MNLDLVIEQHSQAIRTLKNIQHFESLKMVCVEIIDHVHPSLRKCIKKQKEKIKAYDQTINRLTTNYKIQLANIKNGISK